jgi:hypothetical protein
VLYSWRLCGTDRSPTGFEVREQGEGTSEISFSYRIMTKRADVRAGRLERLERPTEAGESAISEPPSGQLFPPLPPRRNRKALRQLSCCRREPFPSHLRVGPRLSLASKVMVESDAR